MARLSVAVLGPPEVRHGERLIAFPTRKALAILVYLLVEGGAQPREKLMTLFWPDSDGEAARATLRSTLARLRASLGETGDRSHLVIERDAIGFDIASDFALDVRRVQTAYDLARSLAGAERPVGEARQHIMARLAQGASAWRGDFLDGFSLRDAADFDDWASLQREAWRRRVETILDRLSLLQSDAGVTASAIETVNRWLVVNPLEERAYRRLMRLALASGDRSAGLRAYETCRAVLDRELGVRPEPETEALAERLRTVATRTPSERTRSLRSSRAAAEGPLVGREDEFANLVETYHAASRGQPHAVVLQGEAGIGKTRLATEFLAWAMAQGADIVRGRAFEAGSRLPYQPLVDALRTRLEREAAPERLLNDPWLTELSRLLPELRERRPDLPLPAGDESAARTRLFEALARLGRGLAAQAPLVLFIDDVQWADIASLDVLRYAGRRWVQDEVPALLIFCLRSEALVGAGLDE